MWFPLVVFGALSFLSAVLSWRMDGDVLGIYWAFAGPLGSVLTAAFYIREERRVGVQMPAWPSVVGAAIIFVGAFTTGALGGVLHTEMVSAVGPLLFVCLGYLIFARIERSTPRAVIAIALAALTVTMATTGTTATNVASLLAAAYGVTFIVTGIVWWRQQSTSA